MRFIVGITQDPKTGEPRRLAEFPTEDAASEYIGTLPGHLDGRYYLDDMAQRDTAPIGRDELAEACRYNDAKAEEHETGGDALSAVLAELGFEIEGTSHVATQRGLRMLGIFLYGDPNSIQSSTQMQRLTTGERKAFMLFSTAFLDGAAAAARAARL